MHDAFNSLMTKRCPLKDISTALSVDGLLVFCTGKHLAAYSTRANVSRQRVSFFFTPTPNGYVRTLCTLHGLRTGLAPGCL